VRLPNRRQISARGPDPSPSTCAHNCGTNISEAPPLEWRILTDETHIAIEDEQVLAIADTVQAGAAAAAGGSSSAGSR
jgi:hypothetical protein